MKFSDAQRRAVELLAGEEGWIRRGTIQQKTMDVLVRLDMVESKRDTAIHVTMYRATQSARDWVRGQREDATMVTADLAPWEIELLAMSADRAPVDLPPVTELDHLYVDEEQDALDAEQERTGVHAACGLKLADHCAHCDTCPVPSEACGCDVETHDECGLPLADHCPDCHECPRTGGPCWCKAPNADEPVTIVEGSTAPGFTIDFGPEITGTTVEPLSPYAASVVRHLVKAENYGPTDAEAMVRRFPDGAALAILAELQRGRVYEAERIALGIIGDRAHELVASLVRGQREDARINAES